MSQNIRITAAEPDAAKDVNIARFRETAVVTDYADVTGARDCEALLFATYIAPGNDILDLGVGGGRTTPILAPPARSYLGVDYSEKMIAVARRNFPQYQFAVMDAADMPTLTSESLDVIVFSFNGLSYLYPNAKRLSCIRECDRLLRQGGIFIFSLHNPYSLFVRPSRSSHSFSVTIKALLIALWDSVKRSYRRILTQAFWRGHGYIITYAHGEMTTFAASVAFVRRELETSGFDFVADFVEGHPRSKFRLLSRWNYYVFRKKKA